MVIQLLLDSQEFEVFTLSGIRVRDTREKRMDRIDIISAMALIVGMVLTGFIENLLKSHGLTTIGTIVWPVGYGAVIITAWYIWIRPLDFRPPGGSDDEEGEADRADDSLHSSKSG